MSKPFNRIFSKPKPAVNIKRDCYTMATSDGADAEITMYGEIVQEQPVDWWTGEPIEGMYIALDQFLEDLKTVADTKRLTVRINSVGGDAYAAITIHNRLKELKAEITVIVDGVAMSGGSLIMCAGDIVKVNPSSLIMIHKCWLFMFGGYNSAELRKAADSNDAVDKAQAAIYKKKSGMSEQDVLAMMENETYMTGEEAIEKGFADELMEGEKLQIAASADCSTIYVNGKALRLTSPLSNLPERIPTVNPEDIPSVKTNNNMPAKPGSEGGNNLMAKNLEELRAENPELANQLLAEAQAAVSADAGAVNAAVESERKRLAEIDEVSALYDEETVQEAKYGEKACTAQEMTFRAAQKAAKQGKKVVGDLEDDTNASGAKKITATPAGTDDDKPLTPAQRMAAGRADAKKIQNKEEK